MTAPQASPAARKASWLSGLSLGLAVLAVPAGVAAMTPVDPQDITLSYAVTTPYAVDNIITFNTYVNGNGSWWPASLPAGGGDIGDPFPKSSANAPLSALILGLSSDATLDSSGATHIVMMLDDSAAQAAAGRAWSSLFPNTDEAVLAQQIKFVTGTTRDDLNAVQWDADLTALYTFTSGDARQASTWFALGAVHPGHTTTTTFSVMAFSDGQSIGSGVASLTAAVPEPQSWALMLAGLAAVGSLAARRRR